MYKCLGFFVVGNLAAKKNNAAIYDRFFNVHLSPNIATHVDYTFFGIFFLYYYYFISAVFLSFL